LEKSNAALRRARDELKRRAADELEKALVRSLLRPLLPPERGRSQPLTNPEIGPLWELASHPSDNLRLRFVSEAMLESALTRQLRNRAGFAFHAAVGLDPDRRAVVEGTLLKRFKEAAYEEQRTDIALMAATLGDLSPEAAAEVAQALNQAMSKSTDAYALHDLAQGVSKVARRLEGRQAVQHCDKAATALSQALTKTTDASSLRALARGLAAVAPSWSPKRLPRRLTLSGRPCVSASS
jgi:hypothetical protein